VGETVIEGCSLLQPLNHLLCVTATYMVPRIVRAAMKINVFAIHSLEANSVTTYWNKRRIYYGLMWEKSQNSPILGERLRHLTTKIVQLCRRWYWRTDRQGEADVVIDRFYVNLQHKIFTRMIEFFSSYKMVYYQVTFGFNYLEIQNSHRIRSSHTWRSFHCFKLSFEILLTSICVSRLMVMSEFST
jgi:hypothetical protein